MDLNSDSQLEDGCQVFARQPQNPWHVDDPDTPIPDAIKPPLTTHDDQSEMKHRMYGEAMTSERDPLDHDIIKQQPISEDATEESETNRPKRSETTPSNTKRRGREAHDNEPMQGVKGGCGSCLIM